MNDTTYNIKIKISSQKSYCEYLMKLNLVENHDENNEIYNMIKFPILIWR